MYCGLYFAAIAVDGKVRGEVAKPSTMVRAGKKMNADRRATAKSERGEQFMMNAASND